MSPVLYRELLDNQKAYGMAMERDHDAARAYRQATRQDRLSRLEQSFHTPLDAAYQQGSPPPSLQAVSDNVLNLSEMLGSQWLEYQHAQIHTNRVFDQLLDDLLDFTDECRQGLTRFFRTPEMRAHFDAFPRAQSDIQRQIYTTVDADRSVGIVNLLWHTISFTMRGNTRPLALQRSGNVSMYAGRIVALLGDFQELTEDNVLHDFPELLSHEIASLYIPAQGSDLYVMRMSHLGEKDHLLNHTEAPREFIAKVVDAVCSGGYFHEKKSTDLF